MSSITPWVRLLSNLDAFKVELAHHIKCRAPFLGPRHAHRDVWQGSFVVSGACEFQAEGDRLPAVPDDFVFIRRAEYHESFDGKDDEYELFDVKFSVARELSPGVVPGIPTLLHVRNTAGVISALERIVRAKALSRGGNDALMLVYLAELLMLLVEESKRSQDSSAVKTNMELSIEQAVEYISLHYGEPLTITDLAELVHVSPSHFAAMFKEIAGVSPIEMLIRTRVSRAKEFLQHTNFPIKRIAAQCGFSSTQYFARLFCRRVGVSPKEYRTVRHSGHEMH